MSLLIRDILDLSLIACDSYCSITFYEHSSEVFCKTLSIKLMVDMSLSPPYCALALIDIRATPIVFNEWVCLPMVLLSFDSSHLNRYAKDCKEDMSTLYACFENMIYSGASIRRIRFNADVLLLFSDMQSEAFDPIMSPGSDSSVYINCVLNG